MLKGLSSPEAKELLLKNGLNVIGGHKSKSKLMKFVEQFNNFLVYLLLAATIVSFIVGDHVDGILILAIVVLNAVFGYYQESKAENALSLLKDMAITKVRVMRDGQEQELDSRYLVPGDVVYLEEGSKIPADAKVIKSVNLEANEASLTGESLSVEKIKNDMIFMGTIVARGHGYAKVVSTGMKTKFGSVAETLATVEEEKTPLQRKLEDLTRIIGFVGIAAGILVFALSFIQGQTYLTAFLLSISLAVAVVPEGLPVVMTITLSLGVREMAKKRAIVRKLAAIEALGSVTLIATDKTGTLTENKMVVRDIYADTAAGATKEFLDTKESPVFAHLVENSVLCSTASLVKEHGKDGYEVLGDPTEGALLLLAADAGRDIEKTRGQYKLLEEMPFDAKTRLMAVLGEQGKHKVAYVKGSPESILQVVSSMQVGTKIRALTKKDKTEIDRVVDKWAGKGLRVLGFGYVPQPKKGLAKLISGKDFVLLGLMALHDAPRAEVPDAIQRAKQAGIKVIMITGDNVRTAEAIGVHTGILGKNEDIMTGQELEKYSDQELLKVLPRVRIFARVKPEDKYRIVQLYQKLGEIVVVTGDGVNDAIALKQANVGVAMGKVGTDVARDVADIVITDDNFATIVEAVAEGRNIVKNLKNSIKYLLTSNFGEAVSLIVGFMLGIPALFYAIQLLYINLISDSFPAIAFAFSPRLPHLMKEPPAKRIELLNRFDTVFIFLAGGLATGIVLATYFVFASWGGDALGRSAAFSTLAVLQSFFFVELWINHRPIHKHTHELKGRLFLAAFITPFILQYTLISVPTIASIFKVTTLSAGEYALTCVFAASSLLGIGLIKRVFRSTV